MPIPEPSRRRAPRRHRVEHESKATAVGSTSMPCLPRPGIVFAWCTGSAHPHRLRAPTQASRGLPPARSDRKRSRRASAVERLPPRRSWGVSIGEVAGDEGFEAWISRPRVTDIRAFLFVVSTKPGVISGPGSSKSGDLSQTQSGCHGRVTWLVAGIRVAGRGRAWRPRSAERSLRATNAVAGHGRISSGGLAGLACRAGLCGATDESTIPSPDKTGYDAPPDHKAG